MCAQNFFFGCGFHVHTLHGVGSGRGSASIPHVIRAGAVRMYIMLRRAQRLRGVSRGARSRGLNTLAAEASLTGIALHSGHESTVRIVPAPAHAGIHFVRVDLSGDTVIQASVRNVTSTVLSTTIGSGDGAVSVGTIEHLMAALCGMGVGACRVEVSAPELPILDGSAAPWVAAIRSAGVVAATQGGSADARPFASPSSVRTQQPATVRSTIRVGAGESWIVAVPAHSPRLTVGIDFPGHAPIGRQWASWTPAPLTTRQHGEDGSSLSASFAEEVAPARTFAVAEQLEMLRARELIQGGSLDNALVCDRLSWLNPTPEGAASPLRFDNEPARHKLLDLVGDLALLGGLPNAHITAFKAGHELHVALAKAIELQARA